MELKTKIMNYSDKERKYLKAKERVEKLRKFYKHLVVYIVVIMLDKQSNKCFESQKG